MKKQTDLSFIVFILGGLFATAVFLCIYGWRVLDPTYDDWLLFSRDGVDNMQHYQGWVAYRKSAWQFPVGLIEGILYPEKISVIYTDSIPLFAFIFKILSPALPETFQYFGIFGIICAFLLGAFSAAFIYSFTERALYSVVCAYFFATAFTFLHRMFYHTALSAQWLVVAALYLWLAIPYDIKRRFSKKRIVLWSLMSVLALLTEAYFLPMIWGIMLCDLLQYGIMQKSFAGFFKAFVLCVISAGVVTIFVGWVFGLFYGDVDSTGLGLGVYTFNLINFVNPFWMSSVIPWLPSDFFQYEGLAYLGLGMLFMAPIAIVAYFKNPKIKRRGYKNISRASIIMFFVGFSVASISPVISIGDKKITVPIPELLARLWSVFRSSGRLIWPVYYLIILMICVAVGFRITNKNLSMGILIAAIVLQIFDARGFIEGLNTKFSLEQTYISSLSNPLWEKLSDRCDHFMICPDTHDIYYTYEGEELERFALTHDMTMNIVYTARVVSDRVNQETGAILDGIRSGQLQPDPKTAYVFLDGKMDSTLPLKYYKLNGFTIGVAEPL